MPSLSRREFLSTGLVATNAALGIHAKAASVNAQISVAVIGVQGIGHDHVTRLLDRSDVRVAALCDIDERVLARAVQTVCDSNRPSPARVTDFRRLLDDDTVDVMVIATPSHWHCPIAIRALQAEKDVYLETPGSHVFREGRLLVEAAKKYDRILQHGTQMRSSDVTARAAELLASGILGTVKKAKAWSCRRQEPLCDTFPSPHVNYDMWLGPASKRRLINSNRFQGNWNLYREYGNGTMGGDGIHEIDMARWGLGITTHPDRITAHGSHIDGDREFPEDMMVAYHYYAEGKEVLYEDRGWTPYGPHGLSSGTALYGTEGWMVVSRDGYLQVYLGRAGKEGPGMRGNGGHPQHLDNFLDCVRNRQQPVAPAEVAHLSCALVHLGDVAYRVGRVLNFDPQTETVLHDEKANRLLTKEYRAPWTVPTST